MDDVKALLGATGHVAKKHPALPQDELQNLLQFLDVQNVVQRALAFYTLSGAGTRLRPTLHMQFDQIEGDVWTVPADLMKVQRNSTDDFRVPITKPKWELIEHSRATTNGSFVFPSPDLSDNPERPISDQALENIMRRREKERSWS